MTCSYTPQCDPLWVLYYWFGLGSSLPSFSLFLHFPLCLLGALFNGVCKGCVCTHHTTCFTLTLDNFLPKKFWISYPKQHAGYLGWVGGGEQVLKSHVLIDLLDSFRKILNSHLFWLNSHPFLRCEFKILLLILSSSERKFESVNMGEGPEYRPFLDLRSVPQPIHRGNRSKSRKGLYSGPFPP